MHCRYIWYLSFSGLKCINKIFIDFCSRFNPVTGWVVGKHTTVYRFGFSWVGTLTRIQGERPRNKRFYPFYSATEKYGVCPASYSVDKKNQLDVAFCILHFSSNSSSTCFGKPCAHHQKLTTAWCYSLVLVCAVAAGRLSSPVGR